MRKNSTMSGLRCTRRPSNKEDWYQAASRVTKDDKKVHFTLFNSMDTNPDTRFKAHKHVSPRRGTLWTWKASSTRTLSSTKPSTAATSVCDTNPKEYIKKVIQIRDRTDTKARIRVSVAHKQSKRAPMTRSWSQTRSTSHGHFVDQDALLEETLSRKKFHASDVNLAAHPLVVRGAT